MIAIDFCLVLGQGVAPWVEKGGGTQVEFGAIWGWLSGYIQ